MVDLKKLSMGLLPILALVGEKGLDEWPFLPQKKTSTWRISAPLLLGWTVSTMVLTVHSNPARTGKTKIGHPILPYLSQRFQIWVGCSAMLNPTKLIKNPLYSVDPVDLTPQC